MKIAVYVVTLSLLAGLFFTLGVKGLVGFVLAMLLFHIAYRVRHGYWFDW